MLTSTSTETTDFVVLPRIKQQIPQDWVALLDLTVLFDVLRTTSQVGRFRILRAVTACARFGFGVLALSLACVAAASGQSRQSGGVQQSVLLKRLHKIALHGDLGDVAFISRTLSVRFKRSVTHYHGWKYSFVGDSPRYATRDFLYVVQSKPSLGDKKLAQFDLSLDPGKFCLHSSAIGPVFGPGRRTLFAPDPMLSKDLDFVNSLHYEFRSRNELKVQFNYKDDNECVLEISFTQNHSLPLPTPNK